MRQIKRCQKSSQKRKNRQDRPEKEIINLLQKAKTILANSGIERPIFEAELILAHLLKIERYNLYVDPPPPSHRIIDEFFLLVSKRTRHIPLAYILKKTYFAGYEFYISKGVFIPRPETEAIISCVCQFIKDTNRKINILDICTGCGALAITLAKLFPFSCVIATDVSKKAVQIARKNVSLHNLQSRISVVNADIVPGNLHEKFSLIVSNPPYLTGNEIEQAEEEVKKEPFYSLYGGKNGMEIICRILKEASRILTDDGILIMEVSPSQIQYFGELKEKELSLISVCRDINGIERFVVLAKRISIC